MSRSPINPASTFAKTHMDVAALLDGQEAERLDDLRSGAAWEALCDGLRELGRGMLAS